LELINVCHASESIVRVPDWKHRDPTSILDPEKKDFGIGFYMCKTMDLAYPVGLYSKRNRVILNEYTLDLDGLNPLNLRVNLVWVMVVAAHRQRSAGTKASRNYWAHLADAIKHEVEKYDIVIGPISNDRFFTVLDDFVDNAVSEQYTIDAVNFMRYPMQYVSKSDKADKKITFVKSSEVNKDELSTASAERDSEKEEMETAMTERRLLERADVKKGIAHGRLFSDVVDACFVGLEGATDEVIRERLSKIIKEWLENGAC